MNKNYNFKFLMLGGLVYVLYKHGLTSVLIGLTVLVTLGTLYSNNPDPSNIGMSLLLLLTYLGIKKYGKNSRKNKWENYMKDIVGKEHFENNKEYYYELKNK